MNPAVTPEKRTGIKSEHLAWGLGSLGTITMISAVSSLYLYFLISVVKLPPALAGTLIFISKLVDMISDPAMGWLSDRTRSRWGRRRPYMFGGSFVGSAVAGLILRHYRGGADAYARVGFFLAAVVLASMLTAVIGTKGATFTKRTHSSMPLGIRAKLFLVNKPFLLLGSVKAVQFLQLATSSAVSLFFVSEFCRRMKGCSYPLASPSLPAPYSVSVYGYRLQLLSASAMPS